MSVKSDWDLGLRMRKKHFRQTLLFGTEIVGAYNFTNGESDYVPINISGSTFDCFIKL